MQLVDSTQKADTGSSLRLSGVADAPSHIDADDERWQLALRIAASRSLGRSQLLADFLLYIVDRSIRGRASELTEQQIGVAVFGRAEDYNSNDDNIVRNYARRLRKRIEEYFTTEGREEILKLEIPRGGYTPIFSSNIGVSLERRDERPFTGTVSEFEVVLPEPAAAASIEDISPASSGFWQRFVGRSQVTPVTLLALLIGIILGGGFMLLRQSGLTISREEAAAHVLWVQLFNSKSDTFIVPSDVGLVIMQRLTERPVPLTSYINGSYRTRLSAANQPDADELFKLGGRRFTNVVDLDFATRLGQLREVVPGRMMIRYARDLRMDDLRTGNAILIGSDEANPWLELFRPQLHFCFRFDSDASKPSGFLNRYPRSGEGALYTTKGQEEQTYGIIAYLPNLSNTGHVVIVAGLNTAGTQAAATFLLDPSSMMPTLLRARSSHGDLEPFELLVGAGNVATNASTPHIILERIGLPQAH